MLTTFTGLEAFGEDSGTLWLGPDSQPVSLTELQSTDKSWRKVLKRRLERWPLVWFVDDERANREWFVENHRQHFALLTFSSRRHFTEALHLGTVCDAVVTDIFFPANPPCDDAQAARLLTIYSEIRASTVSNLPSVWDRWRSEWSLDGFTMARDVAEHAGRRGERIPVLLYSRKAVWLLGSDDWLIAPSSAVENSHWMLEKLDPREPADTARRAASIQRDRINAALKYRQESAAWWKRQLGRWGVGWGPVRY